MPVSITDFLHLRQKLPMVDVRSEAEFLAGHVRGAVNVPLLNNEERVIVGTTYKQKGQREAIMEGFRLVGPRLPEIINETEKIAVEISFRVERSTGNVGGFAQIWNALRESGSVLGDSTASLITTIVAIIPWLVLILPALWLLAKAWRRLKLRRNRTFLPPPSPIAT